MTDEGTGAPEGTQDQQVETTTAAPTPQPQSQGPSTPWDSDVAATFADPSIQAQVSEFLGQKVQPYVTRVEQSAKAGSEFLSEFQERPGETFLEVASELYGPETAKAIQAHLASESEGEYDPFGDEDYEFEAQPNQFEQSTDPRVQRMLQSWEQEQQEKAYNEHLTALKEANPDVKIDDALFQPFAVATQGDLDLALAGYRNFIERARAEFGQAPESVTTNQTNQGPPPAIGSTTGATAPPTVPTGQSLDEAINDFFNEQRAQGNSVVPEGS